MTTILITSIGSLSAVSIAMCLAAVRSAVRIVATNSVAEAAGNFFADRAIVVPPTADADAWHRSVNGIVEDERPDLVLNGRDEELATLSRLSDENQSAGRVYLVPPAALVPVFNDKYETALFAASNDLPFAQTAYTAQEVERLLERHGLPLVAKPRLNGFGGNGACLACTEGDVRTALETGRYVFQEVLPSPPLDDCVSAWNRRIGIPWSWAMRSVDHEVDLLLDDGVVALCLSAGVAQGAFNQDLRIVDEPALRQVGRSYGEVLGRLGHKGPVNIQGRLLSDGRYVPFELNARFTGTMIGKAHLGYNMVLAALHHWCGLPLAEEPGSNGKAVQRAPLFLAFDERAVATMAKSGEWRKP
jgi:carbamoylphosphate synthase large subunit